MRPVTVQHAAHPFSVPAATDTASHEPQDSRVARVGDGS